MRAWPARGRSARDAAGRIARHAPWLALGLAVVGLARADSAAVAEVGSLAIAADSVLARAARLTPSARARFGATWPEQRKRLLEDALIPEALLAVEAARTDRRERPVRDAALAQALLVALQREIAARAPTNAELESYYAAHRSDFETPRSILIWRILVRKESQAKALLAELGVPNDGVWSRLARERSVDTATNMRSGSLGYVAADGQTHMPQLRVSRVLFAAADALKDGQLAPQPVAEGDGFAVVWRRASRAASVRPLAAAASEIRAQLEAERFAQRAAALTVELRQAQLREHQPALLAGYEPHFSDPGFAPPLVSPAPPPPEAVMPSPRATDLGLR